MNVKRLTDFLKISLKLHHIQLFSVCLFIWLYIKKQVFSPTLFKVFQNSWASHIIPPGHFSKPNCIFLFIQALNTHTTCTIVNIIHAWTHLHIHIFLFLCSRASVTHPPQVFSHLFLLLLLFPQFNLEFRSFQLAVLGVWYWPFIKTSSRPTSAFHLCCNTAQAITPLQAWNWLHYY